MKVFLYKGRKNIIQKSEIGLSFEQQAQILRQQNHLYNGVIDMKNKYETIQGKVFQRFLKAINPLKKLVRSNECKVHIFNNIQAIRLLEDFNYQKEVALLHTYLDWINKGSIWADQDFKNINHFYSPIKKRGLFGHSNAMILTQDYYNKALYLWNMDDKEFAMFYIGACVHIIQDVTIPQHANIRLLDRHRHYENFVKNTYELVEEYKATDRPIILANPIDYVHNNAVKAYHSGKKYTSIADEKKRFYKQTIFSLPLSQRTTAGFLLLFLNRVE